jgi:hypothetical protein
MFRILRWIAAGLVTAWLAGKIIGGEELGFLEPEQSA